jgi:hypothetical protein
MEPVGFDVQSRDNPGRDVPPQGYRPGSAHPSGPMATLPPRDAGGPQRPPGQPPRSAGQAPSPWWQQANGMAAPARPAREEQAPPGYPARQRPASPAGGDPLSSMSRVLSAADYEAAAITQQASYQAAMITRQVAHEAAGVREAARREAAEIMQQASMRAAVVREDAEMEAAEIRAAVRLMQAEVSELAARVTGTFPTPVLPPPSGPAGRPPANPTARPPGGPQGRPATGPQGRPRPVPAARPPENPPVRPGGRGAAARPAGRHGARPAPKPAGGQGRQVAAMRVAVIVTSALFLVSVFAGAAEIYLHGFDFFVFRSVGTGETGRGPGGLQENQGPGQPDAPTPTPSHVNGLPSANR